MEPRIQYAKTSDGVSIAYWTLGEGKPFVQLFASGGSHIQLEWEIPEWRRWYERLAEKRKVVRYDMRGFGLSERDVADLSLDAWVLDLEAVVERAELQDVTLFGLATSGSLALAYAVRHPEQVSHVVLFNGFARASEWVTPIVQGVRKLMDQDWRLYSETMSHTLLGWTAGEPASRFAALVRASTTQETLQRSVAAISTWDLADQLPNLTAPTLVLHRRDAPAPDISAVRTLASGIPNARVILLEGASLMPFLGDVEAPLRAIDEFLAEAEVGAGAVAARPTGLVTILFTDLTSSTALTQRLGDAKAQELVRAHNAIVREALRAHGGSEIKHTGDGIMASFPTASGALECAVTIQQAVARSDPSPSPSPAGGGEHLAIHIGLNAGEPIAEEEDLFGTAVQLARRICDQAEGGEILASDVVRQLAAGKDFLFADRGEVALRGFEDPVRLYEVRWREP